MSTPRRPAALALVAWTLLVWTTRLGNIWADEELSAGEKWGRTSLALSFTLLALAVGAAVLRRPSGVRPAVGTLVGWTALVWVVRAVGIAAGDHATAFIVVHLVLAAVSVALAGLALREERRAHPGALAMPWNMKA